MTRRRRSNMITIDVDVDLDHELDDDDLIHMCQERGLSVSDSHVSTRTPGAMSGLEWWERLADEIRDAARASDFTHLNVLLLRMVTGTGLVPIPKGVTAAKQSTRGR